MSYGRLIVDGITTLSNDTYSNVPSSFCVINGASQILGTSANVIYSTDGGSTYQDLTLPADARFYTMVYGNGYYVAGGANTVSNTATLWFSNNLSSWTAVSDYRSQTTEPTMRTNAAFTWVVYDGNNNVFNAGGVGVPPYMTLGNLTSWEDTAAAYNVDRTRFDRQITDVVWAGTGRAMMGTVGNGTTSFSSFLFAVKGNTALRYNSSTTNWYGSPYEWADWHSHAPTGNVSHTTDVIYDSTVDRFLMTANDGKIVTHNSTSNTSIVGSSSSSIYVSPESDAYPGGIFDNRGYRVYDNVSVYSTGINSTLSSITKHLNDYWVATESGTTLYHSSDYTLANSWNSITTGLSGNIIDISSTGDDLIVFTSDGRIHSLNIVPAQDNSINTQMANVDLSVYPAIETGLFVRIECNYYKTTELAEPQQEILRFSDYYVPITIDGELYPAIGQLLSVTAASSELRNSSRGISLTISGIPNSSIAQVIHSRFKGSPVNVYRVIIDPTTRELIAITGRFSGTINNYAIEEEYNSESLTASSSVVFTCSSVTETLSNKVTGRKTNASSQQVFFPDDQSMDRVNVIAKSNFNFGAVVK